jgi:hypothetical protein
MPTVTRKNLLAIVASVIFAAVAVSHTPSAHAPGGYTFSVVATLGDPAPGGGQHVGDFEPEDINGRGDVAFASDLLGDNGMFLGEGLYGRYRGTVRPIARSGDPIPGTNLKYGASGIQSPAGMNDSGDIAFGFFIGTNAAAAAFRYDPVGNKVSPVFLPGDAAPGGTTFRGADFHADLNNRGQIATAAIIDTSKGNCTDQNASCFGLGRGVYTFDRFNNAAKIAAPGDPAPGSASTFDDARDPNLNNGGDVIFGGHVKGEPCVGGSPSTLGCFESLYLYQASTSQLSSIAHRGDPAPGGGVFKFAFNGRLNARGDASFIGALKEDFSEDGVFLRKRNGTLLAVARPGDPLPGGTMKNTTSTQGAHAIDNAGNVAFVAVLDADINGDGVDDTGVYLWSGGTIRTVVRTGTAIPSLGTVVHVNNAYYVGGPNPWPGVHMNERGQILTQVIVDTGANYVIVATPN